MSTGQILTLALAAVLVFWMLGAYNRLVRLRKAIGVAWAHVEAPGEYVFEVSEDAHFAAPVQRLPARAEAAQGLTMQVEVRGLAASTRHHWRLVRQIGFG